MRAAVALFVLLTVILPLTGFLVLGDEFETSAAAVVTRQTDRLHLGTLLAGLLAADLFLPVPSSVVLTYCGQTLGVLWATLAGALGLTVSSEIGYWLGRWGGRAVAGRLVAEDDLAAVEMSLSRSALWWLVVTRPIPLIAEAATVGAGLARVPHAAYLATVVIANAWVCATFAMLGYFGGEEYQWPALILSAVAPLGMTWFVRRRRSAKAA